MTAGGGPSPAGRHRQQAAAWFAVLASDRVTAEEHAAWRSWLDGSARHREAWQEVEAIRQRLSGLPPGVASILRAPPSTSRRRLVGTAVAIAALGAGSASMLTWREAGGDDTLATGTGDVRAVDLPGGGRLWLNADSTVRRHATETLERIELRSGEVFVVSGHSDAGGVRALVVDTPLGRVRALGTRFSVRLMPGGDVRVAVFEGAVRFEPARSGAAATVLQRGRQADFAQDGTGGATVEAQTARQRWIDGTLVADGVRLDEFLQELSAYRPGRVVCAPEVAGLRLLGVFSAADTDGALDAIEKSLPVRVRRITRWWVRVESRA